MAGHQRLTRDEAFDASIFQLTTNEVSLFNFYQAYYASRETYSLTYPVVDGSEDGRLAYLKAPSPYRRDEND